MRKKLSEMKYGEEGVVDSVSEDIKSKAAGMGIRVGRKLKMDTKQPIKGPVVVAVDGSTVSLGLEIADKVSVEVE
ncbi:MAG: FeoA family protein [Halobacteriota archaeon]